MSLFLSPLVIVNGIYEYSLLPKLIIIQLGSLILLFTWLLTGYVKHQAFTVTKCSLYLPLTCFFVWALFSFLWATNRYNCLTLWVHWITCALIFLISLQILVSANRIRILFYTVSTAAMIVSMIGLLQHFFHIDWFLQLTERASTFGNKNMAAQFIVLCFPVVIMLFVTAKGSKKIWASASAVSLLTTYLFHTRTKAAWFAVMAQAVVWALFFLHNRFVLRGKIGFWNLQKIMVAISAAVVVSLLIIIGPADDLSKSPVSEIEATSDDYTTSSVGARLAIWHNTIDLIKTQFIRGVGLNNFGVEYPRIAIDSKRESLLALYYGPRNAHNDFLQMTSELGLPGLFLLVWASFLVLKIAAALFKPHCPQENRTVGITCLAAIAGLAVNACASFPMYRSIPPLLLGIYSAILCRVAMAANPKEMARGSLPDSIKLSRKLVLGSVIVSFLVLGYWSAVQIRWFIADRFSRHRLLAMTEKKWPEVIYWGKKVQRHNPFRPDVKHAMGRAYFEIGKFHEAKNYLLEYKRVYPHATHNLFFLAKNYEKLEDYQNAENTLKFLLGILPDNAPSHNILGRVYGHLNRHEESMREFRIATQLEPDVADFHFNLGIEAYRGQRYEQAAISFNNAVRLDEKWVVARKNLGLILFHYLNRKKEGLVHLKKTLELNPAIEGSDSIRNTIASYEKNVKSATPAGKSHTPIN
ncbi:MAG: O-antigen ligase family protein [Deltaproteobacteria bacterium]|nr:MAG: O-antigen ligase family protein [Deltaproteobacteria bacterium]